MEIVPNHRILSFLLIYPIYNLFSRFRFVCANCPSRADIVCTKTKPKKCTSYDSKPCDCQTKGIVQDSHCPFTQVGSFLQTCPREYYQIGTLTDNNGPDADSLSTMLMITLISHDLLGTDSKLILSRYCLLLLYTGNHDDNHGTANDNDVLSSADDFWLWKPGGLWKAQ